MFSECLSSLGAYRFKLDLVLISDCDIYRKVSKLYEIAVLSNKLLKPNQSSNMCFFKCRIFINKKGHTNYTKERKRK